MASSRVSHRARQFLYWTLAHLTNEWRSGLPFDFKWKYNLYVDFIAKRDPLSSKTHPIFPIRLWALLLLSLQLFSPKISFSPKASKDCFIEQHLGILYIFFIPSIFSYSWLQGPISSSTLIFGLLAIGKRQTPFFLCFLVEIESSDSHELILAYSLHFHVDFVIRVWLFGVWVSFELKSEKRLGKLDLSQKEKIRMKSTKKRQVMSNFYLYMWLIHWLNYMISLSVNSAFSFELDVLMEVKMGACMEWNAYEQWRLN